MSEISSQFMIDFIVRVDVCEKTYSAVVYEPKLEIVVVGGTEGAGKGR